jgi:hypothetical protein
MVGLEEEDCAEIRGVEVVGLLSELDVKAFLPSFQCVTGSVCY